MFDETVASWVTWEPHSRLALVHLDADLYTSTKTVLDAITHLLGPGTVMVCDEILPPFPPEQEWRAVHEWMEAHSVEYEWIARGQKEHASFKIQEMTP
jgi:predicted O-methyltransferase YrrM